MVKTEGAKDVIKFGSGCKINSCLFYWPAIKFVLFKSPSIGNYERSTEILVVKGFMALEEDQRCQEQIHCYI